MEVKEGRSEEGDKRGRKAKKTVIDGMKSNKERGLRSIKEGNYADESRKEKGRDKRRGR